MHRHVNILLVLLSNDKLPGRVVSSNLFYKITDNILALAKAW